MRRKGSCRRYKKKEARACPSFSVGNDDVVTINYLIVRLLNAEPVNHMSYASHLPSGVLTISLIADMFSPAAMTASAEP